ncbi:fibronectin type III domain-containing protein [Paenibacillus swuensis]|nr:glycosyl hydrolase family 18 protein [Paenibacillus swuensis]
MKRKGIAMILLIVLMFSIFPVTAFGASEWAPNTPYKINDFVTYSGSTYKCIQAHTSLTGWEPPVVPALWQKQSGTTPPPDTQAPTAPGALSAGTVTNTSIALSWTASSDNTGVTGYDVYRGTVLAGTVTGTAFTATGLPPNTAYTFTVKAKDAAGNISAASNAVTATTSGTTPPPDTQAPSAPAGLSAGAVTSSSIAVSWNASTDNVAVTGYNVYNGSALAGSTTGSGATSFTVTGLAANTTYSLTVKAKDAAGNLSAASAVLSVRTSTTNPQPTGAKILVGYWHNFDNGSTVIRLRDVSPKYDVINVSFAETLSDHATLTFAPFNATPAEFKSDIAYLQSLGKKVHISIGGANATVELNTAAAKQNYVNSLKSIIQTYGFDGIDIDLEGSSLSLNGGDTDYKNPTTPKVVNLISATREVLNAFGPGFELTMAPETAYVQGGLIAYGGPWGAYLPVIHALRDRLNYIHVQHYNSGAMEGLDGRSYSQGTADFQVAMAEMLLKGFPVARNQANMFASLRPEQVAIGLPASRGAAGGGYTSTADVQKALNYLIKGQSYGGAYQLQTSGGYGGFRGLMTWSINWDKYNNYEFSNTYRSYFDNL